VDVFI
jgi:hypothetical protein